MDLQKKTILKGLLPFWTMIFICGAVAASLFPPLASRLIYERAAVWRGEIWRLLSAHLVHFDLWHLGYNLSSFLVAGWLLEVRLRRPLGWLLLAMALTIGLFLALAKPAIDTYGGLSGLVVGAFVYLALCSLEDAAGGRLWGLLLLSLLILKLAAEYAAGDSLLCYPVTRSFQPVWESHALGSLAAVGIFLCHKLRRRRLNLGRQTPDTC